MQFVLLQAELGLVDIGEQAALKSQTYVHESLSHNGEDPRSKRQRDISRQLVASCPPEYAILPGRASSHTQIEPRCSKENCFLRRKGVVWNKRQMFVIQTRKIIPEYHYQDTHDVGNGGGGRKEGFVHTTEGHVGQDQRGRQHIHAPRVGRANTRPQDNGDRRRRC